MNPRSHTVFGSDIGFPEPSTVPTASSALADYQAALAVQRIAEARSFAAPDDPKLRLAVQDAKVRTEQAYAFYVRLANTPPRPATSANAFRVWQQAVQRHASPALIAIYKRTYERLAAAEKKAGKAPYVPTGDVGPDGKDIVLGDSTAFHDVLVAAALTSPAWVPILWGWFRR